LSLPRAVCPACLLFETHGAALPFVAAG
jgi:hypothetical protein